MSRRLIVSGVFDITIHSVRSATFRRRETLSLISTRRASASFMNNSPFLTNFTNYYSRNKFNCKSSGNFIRVYIANDAILFRLLLRDRVRVIGRGQNKFVDRINILRGAVCRLYAREIYLFVYIYAWYWAIAGPWPPWHFPPWFNTPRIII